MKILQLIQKKQYRGAEIFACQLSLQLQTMGHQVRVMSLETGEVTLPFESIEVLHAAPEKLLDWKAWRTLAILIHKWQPDVIQANAGDTLRYSVVSKYLFRWKAPIVFRNASLMSLYIRSPFIKWIYRRLLNRISGIVSVSEASKKDLLQLYSSLQTPIAVIPIGIEPAQLDVVKLDTQVLEPFLLHVGGFTFEKNHAGLLRICANIWKTHPELKLILAGSGPLMDEVKEQAAQLRSKEQCQFMGNYQEIGSLMKRARLLVLPSTIEGLPGVVLEAMYCRLPVIAYEVGGINEVILSGKTGWLISPGDEESFAHKVLEVLHNPDLRASVIQPAYDFVCSHFVNAQIADRFIELYSDLSGRIMPSGVDWYDPVSKHATSK
jgi:glycosyltransferase involved in cell wall biosynthesis